jgi:ankyrin repeat protein
MSDELFEAIEGGDLERVRKLVADDPACASARNSAGVSAVLTATYRHRPDVVEALLVAAPALDVFAASALGDVGRLTELFDSDPSAVTAFAPDGFFPLALAAYFGRPEAIRLLLGRGADVHATARNPMQVRALHAAVAGRSLEAVAVLVDAGADPGVAQHGGWTPLMGAAAHGDADIVDVLLAAGADPEASNQAGDTAASLADEHGHRPLAERLRGLSR